MDALFNYLKLSKEEFLFQYQSHPDSPSALAFSDTLNFLGIKNDAYELEKEYWGELPEEFITIYKNNFALIKKEHANYKVFAEDVITISKEKLDKNSREFVLLFEKEEQVKTKNTTNYKNWFFVILALLLAYSFYQQRWFFAVFNLLSVVGIYVSLELFNKKFGQTSVVLNNICGGGATNSQANCSKIIDSDKINILGLKVSDLSLVYFISVLLVGVFLPSTSLVLKIVTATSVLVILYSLFIQIFVEKAICKICLVIITILIFQIGISQFLFPNFYSFNGFFLSLLTFVSTFFAIVFINDILKQKEDFKKSNLKNFRFKRNYEIFKRELLLSEKINFENNYSAFFFGNKNAKLHISLISNPYCGYCKEAHRILEKILKKYPNEISAQIRFNFEPEKEHEKSYNLMRIFYTIYQTKGEVVFSSALNFWYENRDEKIISKNYNINFLNTDLQPIVEASIDNAKNELNFTPIFLFNGYQFPDKYDREDIFYFIDELIEDDFFN